MQTYELGVTGDRIMVVKNADDDERISIVLMIKGHDVKCVQFSPSRWSVLHEYVDDINIAARAVDIALRFDEWAHLCSLMQSLRNDHPSLKLAHPCHLNHPDQPTFFTCLECSPFANSV